MSLRRASGVLAAAAMLALLVWVSVRAQSPRPKAPQSQSARSGTYAPAPPTRSAPAISFPAPGTFPVQPASASNPYASSAFGSFQSGADAPPSLVSGTLVPVKLQLAGGLHLEGNIDASGPLPCAATFGEVSIPLTAIRGIRLHEGTTNANTPLPAATVILNNSDSLTVSLRATQMQIKTAWGTAIVDLPHVQSLLLAQDDVQWQQAGERWILVPVEKTASVDNPAPTEKPAPDEKTIPADTAPAIPPQAPRLDVPPTIGAPTF